jgi:hypothetical protein
MSQVGRLKYTADKWNVEIDGYSIPFPNLHLAQGYLAYIRMWEGNGEIISYDHANQTLCWFRKDALQVSRRQRCVHRYKQSTQFQTKATPKDSSL